MSALRTIVAKQEMNIKKKEDCAKVKTKQIRVKERTHEEIIKLAEITGHQFSTIVELAWQEFKKSNLYAQLMLFGDNDGE